MAAIDRSVTNSARLDPVGYDVWQEYGVLRPGYDSRDLGLAATANPCDRNKTTSDKVSVADEDVELLAQLIGGQAGAESRTISRSLLARYGNLASLVHRFQTEKKSDRDVPPSIEHRLCVAARAVTRLLRQEIHDGPVISDPKFLAAVLRSEMSSLPRETFRVLFLDAGNRLLADEIMWEGTVNRVQIHAREVIRRAIETGATALVVAHNHPGGDPSPSRHDVAMTNRLVAACAPIDLIIHDHIVVGKLGWFSMAAHGLMFPARSDTDFRTTDSLAHQGTIRRVAS